MDDEDIVMKIVTYHVHSVTPVSNPHIDASNATHQKSRRYEYTLLLNLRAKMLIRNWQNVRRLFSGTKESIFNDIVETQDTNQMEVGVGRTSITSTPFHIRTMPASVLSNTLPFDVFLRPILTVSLSKKPRFVELNCYKYMRNELLSPFQAFSIEFNLLTWIRRLIDVGNQSYRARHRSAMGTENE
ncbi:hypothetical protein T440DRAFT_82201 [Plenodomus tracheiphilus IPT5]|uniref:Uncharacterized protein n=1 Tax=Plenodomus tracheiphilus IPT5 TaxID=1408161 RepID=A0A6A7B8G6_9PLEO|nr:hypothetical protein T440DRAFT_82201 [Plenodomus tracheiphilus IPT5]